MASQIPCAALNSKHEMPVIAFGSVASPPVSPQVFRLAILDAVAVGYRHFDTASFYGTEERLGKALKEAVTLGGLVKSRDELFITTKLWMTDCQQERVLPALHQSLRLLQQDYVDLYLIHWPVSLINDRPTLDFNKENLRALDIESVWKAMEECSRLGLAKSIGVSNFSCKKLEQLLQTAVIPPAVNQVELNPVWQQMKLIEFCKQKDIKVVAYSPLGAKGAPWGSNKVMDCEVLKKIGDKRGKSLAQVGLRWIYEQGAAFVCKSFNKGRMIENASILDWELSEEELEEISRIPQWRACTGEIIITQNGPFKSLQDLWDDEV